LDTTRVACERLRLDDAQEAFLLFGHNDAHLRAIEEQFDVRLQSRGSEVVVTGSDQEVARVSRLLHSLLPLAREGSLDNHDVAYAIRLAREGNEEALAALRADTVITTYRGKAIRPKSSGQKNYVDAIRSHGITFGIGPAGTGKTYLAVALAVAAFKSREYNRIVLTRPAVEAGEKLGFLPGGLEEKVNPYLRPLYDALFDILGVEAYERLLGRNVIEVAPLAYMRGRTLDDSFIILDEAQNTTPEQMKMFLTRLGLGSRAVITGDITQVDLPRGQVSGLEEARRVLADVEGIAFVYLTEEDVVRHELVTRIIKAYERWDREKEGG
jgi:phosphate starvation-inducible PhoH-like protein